jgi:kynureninase
MPHVTPLAAALDSADPLSRFRDRFVIEDDLAYLDGNSLGRLPRAAIDALARVTEEWGGGLVESWDHWIDLPQRVGAALAPLIGAHPSEVALSDSTSVNLYKLAAAALDAFPNRRVLVADDNDFTTDRYVLEGLAAARGAEVRYVETDPVAGVTAEAVAAVMDGDVALASFSLVSYRSGAFADLAAITDAVRSAGALSLWDLSHAVGAVPIDLSAAGVDLAVGCTYKYLNGGPGAPAFVYVRRALHGALHQPILGWFGHAEQFAFARQWRPAPGISRFLVGTPPILSLAAAAPGIELFAEAGLEAIRAKSTRAIAFLVDLYDRHLAPLGVRLGTPRDPKRRGSHIALEHPEGLSITRWLRAERRVVTDFRAPATIRIAVAPLYTTYRELEEAVEWLRETVAEQRWNDAPSSGTVT